MYSIAFPNMFTNTRTNLIEDHKAIASNLQLLLGSERLSLFGDPYFGSQLKKFFYEQNAPIIVDLLIDEIYTTITTFMPQLSLERKDIKITNDGINIFAQISCIYLLDRTANLYTIRLTSDSEDSEIQRGE